MVHIERESALTEAGVRWRTRSLGIAATERHSRRWPPGRASRGQRSRASSTARRGSARTSAAASRPRSVELGYVPNRAARSLVTRRSGSIGVVITEPAGRLFTDPFFPRLLRGISASLSARDLQLVLLMPASSGEAHRTADYLSAGHVDGALLVSLHRRRPAPRAHRGGRHPDGRRRPAPARHGRQLRRRRQPRRRPQRRRPPHRRRPADDRDHRRPARHGGGARSPLRLPRRPRRGRSGTRPEPPGERGLHPGGRRARRWNSSSPPGRTSTRSSSPPT